MILALMAVGSATTYAQDIKTILAAKDYKEAQALVESSLSSLTNEDKAKAYNKIVDLALAKYNKESEVELSNQVTKKNDAYDKTGMYLAAIEAMKAAEECDKYDNMPNEKGKVKVKYRKANGDRLLQARIATINAGQEFYDQKDYKGAATAFGMYVDSSESPIFKTDKEDQARTQIAYFAALSAFFAEDYNLADKYSDIAISDQQYEKDAMQIKINAIQNTMKSHEDSIAGLAKFEKLYEKYPSNQMVFGALSSVYLTQNRTDDFNALVDKALAADPNNFAAIAMRGQAYMNAHKWDEAIADLNKALEIQPDNVPVTASIGNCYMFLAQEKAEQVSAKTKGRIPKAAEDVIIGVYKDAISYFEKARDLDKKLEFKSSWAYSLYTCCYRIYGEEDAKTKEAEAYTK